MVEEVQEIDDVLSEMVMEVSIIRCVCLLSFFVEV